MRASKAWKPALRQRGTSWQVDFGKDPETGKRIMRSFKSKEEALLAQENASESFKAGAYEKPLALSEKLLAQKAFSKLVESGHTKESILDAVKLYCESIKPNQQLMLFSELVKIQLKDLELKNSSKRWISQASSILSNFSKKYGNQTISSLKGSDLQDYLAVNDYSWHTKSNIIRVIKQTFNTAVKRELINKNPFLYVEQPKTNTIYPKAFTLEEVKTILKTAEDKYPELVLYFAIGLFAGLRPESEIRNLKWGDINFETDIILVDSKKTGKRRHVDITPNLKSWLIRYKPEGIHPNTLIYWNYKKTQEIKNLSKVQWIQDGMRHSYASYHLAKFKNAALTSLQLGHWEQNTLHTHYRDLVKDVDANKYFEIMPTQNIL